MHPFLTSIFCFLLLHGVSLVQIDTDYEGMQDKWVVTNSLNKCDPTEAYCDNDSDLVLNLFENQYTSDSNSLAVTGTTREPVCNSVNGNPGGRINVTASGGTPGYTYLWSSATVIIPDPSFEDLSDLGAGTYDLTVTDATGCSVTESFTLTEPTIISILASVDNSDCNVTGRANGSIITAASGGTPPYSYSWTTQNGSGLMATQKDQSGLSEGLYNLVVTDRLGCQQSDKYSISELNPQACPIACDPELEDSDNDGMPNVWEIANGLDECDPVDAFCDYDGDHIINLFEYRLDSDPFQENSPRIIERTSIDNQEFIQLINSTATGSPLVLRLAEGVYENLSYTGNGTSLRFMVQGGWDIEFMDQDPFIRRTTIRGAGQNATAVFSSEEAFSTNTSNILSILFEGLELTDLASIIMQRGGAERHIGVYNCSFNNSPTGYGRSRSISNISSIDGIGGRASIDIINTTIANDYPVRASTRNAEANVHLRVINSTLTDIHNTSENRRHALFCDLSDGTDYKLDIANSIVWDEQDFNSFVFWTRSTGTFEGRLGHSFLSLYDLEAPTGNLQTTLDIRDGVLFQDPDFGSELVPHYNLSSNSPGIEAGEINGLPSYKVNPDIGVNQFAYSSLRLIDSIEVVQPACGLDNGIIRISMVEHHKTFEFSLNNMNAFEANGTFTNLGAGDYIINIRTADNCAHFRQKITLESADIMGSLSAIETRPT